MKRKHRIKLIREGKYVAEVDVALNDFREGMRL
jgi:hypothetical protein